MIFIGLIDVVWWVDIIWFINIKMKHLLKLIDIVESNSGLRVPDEIRLDLVRFTEFAGRKLKPATLAWLKSHPELRGNSFPVVVYRGVTIEYDDFKGQAATELVTEEVKELPKSSKIFLRFAPIEGITNKATTAINAASKPCSMAVTTPL